MWRANLPLSCARTASCSLAHECLFRILAQPFLASQCFQSLHRQRQYQFVSLAGARLTSSSRQVPRGHQRRRPDMRLSGSSWQVPSGRPPRRSVQASAAVPYPRADAAQNFSQYFATCHPGLEDVVAAELNSPDVGASDISHGKAGVSFRGGVGVGYRANLWLRSSIRVLQLVAESQLNNCNDAAYELYAATRRAASWEELLSPRQTFTVDARVAATGPPPSLVCTRVKDAVCDAIRDAGRDKPMPREPGERADLPLFVTCFGDHFMLYRDLSGASLHRRGYRSVMHRASLNEAAAAGILRLAGWHDIVAQDPTASIADPMCGSGTFLIEAALMAMNVAPGLFRGDDWPFQEWPDFDGAAWDAATDAAAAAQQPWRGAALGSDIHEGALELAARDAKGAGVLGKLGLRRGSAATWHLPLAPALAVTNPPWGQRLMNGEYEEGEELAAAWKELATFFKGQCNERAAFVLSGAGSKFMTRNLRMKAEWKVPLTIGGVDARLLKYSVLPKLTAEKFQERAAMLDAR